jgi:hypothetical protein
MDCFFPISQSLQVKVFVLEVFTYHIQLSLDVTQTSILACFISLQELMEVKASLSAAVKSKENLEKTLNTHRVVSRIERESLDTLHMETIKVRTTQAFEDLLHYWRRQLHLNYFLRVKCLKILLM